MKWDAFLVEQKEMGQLLIVGSRQQVGPAISLATIGLVLMESD